MTFNPSRTIITRTSPSYILKVYRWDLSDPPTHFAYTRDTTSVSTSHTYPLLNVTYSARLQYDMIIVTRLNRPPASFAVLKVNTCNLQRLEINMLRRTSSSERPTCNRDRGQQYGIVRVKNIILLVRLVL